MPRPSNRDLMLDTAERLFASDGVDRISLRTICAEAGLNVAAANYYFGTKDDLVEAIVLRRMSGVMARRSTILDNLASDPHRPTVAGVIEALVLPLAELIESEGDSGRSYVRFVARLLVDHSTALTNIVATQFQQDIDRLGSLLETAAPAIPAPVLHRRLALAVTTVFQSLGEPAGVLDGDAAAELVDFVAGGISAPMRTRAARKGPR